MAVIDVALSDQPLDVRALTSTVARNDCGAQVTFEGAVRSPNLGVEVLHLEYEAYEGVAEQQMRQVVAEVAEHHGLQGVVAVHRTGRVLVGEPAIVVSVVAPHRAAAFAGCSEIVDRIKAEVAIWKKEVAANGSHWVG